MKIFNYVALIATATLAMTSCSNDELTNAETANDQTAINFSTYLGRAPQSRAGVTETGAAFGVFAYYTKNDDFGKKDATQTPNFMFNQKVTRNSDGTTWSYNPVKYWPNNNGEKVSFFAYAPFSANTGNLTFATVDAMKGTPTITVKVDKDLSETTDFVAASVINQVKPADGTVTYTLLHEMSRLSLSAKLDPSVAPTDGNGNSIYDDGTNTKHNKTFVVVKSVELEAGENSPIYSQGTYTFSTVNSSTDNRGSWNVDKGSASALHFNSLLKKEKVTASTAANKTAVNPDGNYKTGVEGVKLTKTNSFETLFKDNQYAFLIPVANNALSTESKLKITYDIVTEDAALDCGFSCTPVIAEVSLPTSNFLEQGKAYDLQITIGLKEVQLTASASNWVLATNTIDVNSNTTTTKD